MRLGQFAGEGERRQEEFPGGVLILECVIGGPEADGRKAVAEFAQVHAFPIDAPRGPMLPLVFCHHAQA